MKMELIETSSIEGVDKEINMAKQEGQELQTKPKFVCILDVPFKVN